MNRLKYLLLTCSLALLAGCGASSTPPVAQQERVVKVFEVGAVAGPGGRVWGGDVRARHEALVGFRVGGKLAERAVEVGSTVKAGQVLARLDADDLTLRRSEADAQRAQAAAEAKRYRDLQAQNYISLAALEARETALTAANAQAALARNQTGYAVLSADRDGVVAEVLAEPGQVVAAGQAVFRMAWAGEREIDIALPETAVSDLKAGAAAEVTLWSQPGHALRGRLREVAPVADAATRSYRARVTVLADGAPVPLGMSATVRFNMPAAPALLLPLAALFQQGDGMAVWVIGADQTVTLRPITVSAYTDAGVRVESGLAPGEKLVAAGVHKLHAGEKVRLADAH